MSSCSYLRCRHKATRVLAFNLPKSWGSYTVPLPMCEGHPDPQGQMISLTYLEGRNPTLQIEFLPPESAAGIQEMLKSLANGVENDRSVWKRLWAQERNRKEFLLDLMADLLHGLGVPFGPSAPLALPPELRHRLAKLWCNSHGESTGDVLEDWLMMLDGSTQWIAEESST